MALTARITRTRRSRSRCPAPGNSRPARLERAAPPPPRDSDPGDTRAAERDTLRPSRNPVILQNTVRIHYKRGAEAAGRASAARTARASKVFRVSPAFLLVPEKPPRERNTQQQLTSNSRGAQRHGARAHTRCRHTGASCHTLYPVNIS